MKTLIKRNSPCSKCGSIYNYKCRSCVGCAKNKSHAQYSRYLKLNGKKRNKIRGLAKKEGKNVYQSFCNKCGSNEKYVTSASCVECHKENSKKAYAKKKHLEKQKFWLNAQYQQIFNTMMDYNGEVEDWYQQTIKNTNFNKKLVEEVRKTGRKDEVRQKVYFERKRDDIEIEEISKFENNFTYVAYLKALKLYERLPDNPKYILRLLEAEFYVYANLRKKYSQHPKFPKKYTFLKPDEIPGGDCFAFHLYLQGLKADLSAK